MKRQEINSLYVNYKAAATILKIVKTSREPRQQNVKRSFAFYIDELRHIFKYADVLHCERIEEVADRYIKEFKIKQGTYDNVAKAKDNYPSYWDLGKIYMRLVRDIGDKDPIINEEIQVCSTGLYR